MSSNREIPAEVMDRARTVRDALKANVINGVPESIEEFVASELDIIARALMDQREASQRGGWVIRDGMNRDFRTWRRGFPEWTPDRDEALRLHRKEDAERLAAEDEDAWHIVPFAYLPPVPTTEGE